MIVNERDVTSIVHPAAVLHRLSIAFNGDGDRFCTSRATTAYRMRKVQPCSAKKRTPDMCSAKRTESIVEVQARTRRFSEPV